MSLITLKSRRELGKMQAAGALVAQAHALAREMLQPGTRLSEIDAAVEAFFQRHHAIPLFKGFPGSVPYPAVTCISLNEQIVHGIPGDRKLNTGDIVSLDTACRLEGWCGDAAWTYAIGEVDDEKRRLMDIGEQALLAAIEGLKTDRLWSQVARRMMDVVHRAGFSIVEQFVGHGIGREMHEPPQVPNFTNTQMAREDFELQPGLVLAIEPMINAGSKDAKILSDGWTAVTTDNRPSVHFEHTVAITREGPLLLTQGVGDPAFPAPVN